MKIKSIVTSLSILALVACSNNFKPLEQTTVENSTVGNGASPTPLPTPNACVGLPLDTLKNGSFEIVNDTKGMANGIIQSNLVAAHFWDQYLSVDGWKSVDQKGIELWGGEFDGVKPTDGNLLMEIKGVQPNFVAQEFCTTAGYKKISLDVFARTGMFGDNVVDVSVDGIKLLHIDPAHRFFKTYEVGVQLTAGKHTLQFSSETGTNISMGGLIDNVRLTNSTAEACREIQVGVETVLLTLSDMDPTIARKIIRETAKRAAKVPVPKILFVKALYHNNEGFNDFTLIPTTLTESGFAVTLMEEPVTGLTAEQVSGYDVIWFTNPGYPAQINKTLLTLMAVSQSGQSGVVLSGDDIAGTSYINMALLTKLDYLNNGTSACSQAIDNNQTPYKYIVQYQGLNFVYGNDVDHSNASLVTAHSGYQKFARGSSHKGMKVYANASTNIPGCLLDVPAMVGYKVEKK